MSPFDIQSDYSVFCLCYVLFSSNLKGIGLFGCNLKLWLIPAYYHSRTSLLPFKNSRDCFQNKHVMEKGKIKFDSKLVYHEITSSKPTNKPIVLYCVRIIAPQHKIKTIFVPCKSDQYHDSHVWW